MKALLRGWIWAVGVVAVGCGPLRDDRDEGGRGGGWEAPDAGSAADPGDEPPAEDCDPTGTEGRRAVTVVDATEASVHELITCGGAQVTVARTLPQVVLASNESFVSPEARRDLAEFTQWLNGPTRVRLAHDADGAWTMPVQSAFSSDFRMVFHAPGVDAPLLDDVFDLETYLPGAHAEGSMTWDEMKARPEDPSTFTFTWDHDGPLTPLLFPEGVPADRRFQIALNLIDIAYLVIGLEPEEPERLGPFRHLGDLEIESRATIDDDQGGVRIRYDAVSGRGRVADLAAGGTVHFLFGSLAASDGTGPSAMRLTGTADGLRFVDGAGLGGRIDYRLRGGGRDFAAVSDFGDGARYADVSWACP
jgi:hypothetical protein